MLPNLAHLTSVKHVIPSVKGDITIDIKRTDDKYSMKLISPESTTAVVGIPKSSFEPQSITANGTPIWKDGNFVSGAEGLEGITDAGEDDDFIKFQVAAGSWEFKAK